MTFSGDQLGSASPRAINGRKSDEPAKRPLRILDEITALEKGRNLGVIAETIVNSKAGRLLCDYADVKNGPRIGRDRILSAMLDLDGLVAKSPFDKISIVGMLDKLLGDVFISAEDDQQVKERSVSVRTILREYIPKNTLAISGIDFNTE